MKKILIIGASGFVGENLFKYLSSTSNHELIGTYYSQMKKDYIFLDYTKKKSFIRILEKLKPDVIVWSAGEKNLSRTENDISFDIKENLEPIKDLVFYQKNQKTSKPYLIFLSSDYVFSGIKGNYTTKDVPDPKTKYGLSKYYSELEIINNSKNYCILRVGGIVGEGGKFFNWICNEIKNHHSIDLYKEYFSPTPIMTLCETVFLIIQKQLKGIFHISGNTRLSKFQFGLELKKCFSNNKSVLIEKKESKNILTEDRSLISSIEFLGVSDLNFFLKRFKP
ncbi:MAG: hypothetical protein CMD29_04350 [Flavobacteriales bacterium]|nr:hypothetical protein [Flavobacteriales bacterium]